MIALIKRLLHAFLFDEQAALRWLRGIGAACVPMLLQIVHDDAWTSWTWAQWKLHLLPSLVAFVVGSVIGGDKTPQNVKALAARVDEADAEKKASLPTSVPLAIIFALFLFAPTARAQSIDPVSDHRFGGCSVSGNFCAGPAASLSLVGMSLKTGEFQAGLIPGAGYAFSFYANQWYKVGIGLYAAIQTGGTGGTSGLFSGLISFADYIRLGVGYQVIGGNRETILLLGFGMDFNVMRTPTAAVAK